MPGRHLRGVPGAAVGEGGVGDGLLQRRDHGAALAEGDLEVVPGEPAAVGEGLGVLGVLALDDQGRVDSGQVVSPGRSMPVARRSRAGWRRPGWASRRSGRWP